MNNCESFEAQLNNVLDLRRLPQQSRDLQVHASECTRCHRLLEAYLVMLEGVTELGCCAPQLGFTERIVADVENDRWSSRSRARAIGSLAAAAALLLAAFWGLRSGGPDRISVNQQTQLARGNPQQQQFPADPTTSDAAGERPRPTVGLFEDKSEELLVELLLFAGIVPRAGVFDTETGRRTSSAADWFTEMTEGLKPVSDSTSGALDHLVDAFPLEEDSGS